MTYSKLTKVSGFLLLTFVLISLVGCEDGIVKVGDYHYLNQTRLNEWGYDQQCVKFPDCANIEGRSCSPVRAKWCCDRTQAPYIWKETYCEVKS